MFIRYFKGEPNMHVVRYRRGRVTAHGAGLAFWYTRFNTSIALVPEVKRPRRPGIAKDAGLL